MNPDTVVTLVLAIFGAGAHWGQVRAHLKSVEKRLSHLEAQLDAVIHSLKETPNAITANPTGPNTCGRSG